MRLALISKEGKITAKQLSGVAGVSVAAISQWLTPLVSKSVLTWCDGNGVKFQDVEALEKGKRSGHAYVGINRTFGLPSPYDLTGDERWSPDGELFREYDLELEDAADSGSWNDAHVEVVPGCENDSAKIIDFSKMHQTPGVKRKQRFRKKTLEITGGSATLSEISAVNLYDEFSGIRSFN